MKNAIIFDIETGPLPDAELLPMLPPFDPAEVKTGNIKDPEKIAAKVAECEANHWRECREKAALDAMTGRVLAIGIREGEHSTISDCANEGVIVQDFWNVCRDHLGRGNKLIGFNCNLFDLPFLVRRSWRLGVPVPLCLRQGRYWNPDIIDLRDIWQLGDRQAHGSLDRIARHLGVGQKTGDGADFAALYATNREAALGYLRNDLELTAKIAERLIA